MSDLDAGAIWEQAQDKLRSLESSQRLRRDFIDGIPQDIIEQERQENDLPLLNFCSNDYLDLAHHPAVKSAAMDAVKEYGAGTGSSRLVSGTLPIHHQLEEALAELKGTESALVFSSGYMAAVGAVQALSRRSDDTLIPVIFDRLCHASLVDGAKQERRSWRSFPHNNLESLELLLRKDTVHEWPSALVVTEGIFSMDGDTAPLKELADLCAKYQALLLVDDAHGTGTVGEHGQGSLAAAGISSMPHVVQVGTLSKALGSQGGFVAGPAVLRSLLVNTARTFIFDTALAPGSCGAALAAVSLLKKEPQRLQRLHKNVDILRTLLNRKPCPGDALGPIVPVIIGVEGPAVAASRKLRAKGFLVPAIRPPTVPQGTSRLRITLSSAHKEEDVRRLGQTISMLGTS